MEEQTIKMLMTQSLEGTIKALQREHKQEGLGNFFKESTAHALGFRYLHLHLSLTGRAMQNMQVKREG